MDPDQIVSAALCFVKEYNKLSQEQMKVLDSFPFDFRFALGDLHDSTLEGSPSIFNSERMEKLS